jgi:putative methionine-R-sulfoxide reductase with GAF domain
LETIWEHSQGVPRVINSLCFNALVLAHSFNQYKVDQFLVREVAARLDLHALINDQNRPAREPRVAVTGQYTSHYIAAAASDEKEKANDLENAFRLIAERVQAVTGATGAAVGFLEGGYMVCRGTSGSGTPDEGSRINVDSGLTGECFRTRQILRCDDTEVDSRVDRVVCRQLGIRSIVSIPLSEEGSTVGLIEIFSGRTNAFRNLHLLKLEAMLQSMILKRAGARTTGRDKPDMPSVSPTSEPAQGTDKISNRGSLTRQTGLQPKETPPRPDLSQARPASADAVPLKATSQPSPNEARSGRRWRFPFKKQVCDHGIC